MRLYNDVIQESQLVYGSHTKHLNINTLYLNIGNRSVGKFLIINSAGVNVTFFIDTKSQLDYFVMIM